MDKVELSPQEARQGEISGRVRKILGFSMVGAVVALIIVAVAVV